MSNGFTNLSPSLHVRRSEPLRQETEPKRRRQRGVILQTSWMTCGPAAVASLLKFYFGEDTSEDEIARLAHTYEKRTSTLLDLRDACRAKGYEATGYRLTLPQLLNQIETGGVPVVAHFKEPSHHYVLVTGQEGDRILVSDPARGNTSMKVKDFLRRWSGNALVVKSRSAVEGQ